MNCLPSFFISCYCFFSSLSLSPQAKLWCSQHALAPASVGYCVCMRGETWLRCSKKFSSLSVLSVCVSFLGLQCPNGPVHQPVSAPLHVNHEHSLFVFPWGDTYCARLTQRHSPNEETGNRGRTGGESVRGEGGMIWVLRDSSDKQNMNPTASDVEMSCVNCVCCMRTVCICGSYWKCPSLFLYVWAKTSVSLWRERENPQKPSDISNFSCLSFIQIIPLLYYGHEIGAWKITWGLTG